MTGEFIANRFSKIVVGKSTITKSVLVEAVMMRLQCPQAEAVEIVEVIFDEMMKTLEEGWDLKLSNFGNFELRDKKARPGRNPRTLVDHEIGARRVVTFAPSPYMREAVKGLKIESFSS